MKKSITIRRNGVVFPAEILRQCRILCDSKGNSYSIYLIKREVKMPFVNQFVVGVRSGNETKEFMTFDRLNRAIIYYVDMIACYA